MSRLQNVLDRTAPSGVYRFQTKADTLVMKDKAELEGWRVFYLDGTKIHSKAEFLREAAVAFDMPKYVGKNWDAFEEAVNDLAWAPTHAGYLVLFDYAADFAADCQDDFATAVSIFDAAAQQWAAAGTPFYVLIRRSRQFALGLPRYPHATAQDDEPDEADD